MIFKKMIVNLINKFLDKINAQLVKRSFFEQLYNQSSDL